MLAGCDTFRAAARQLKNLVERNRQPRQGLRRARRTGLSWAEAARARATEVLIVDTAGRLPNKAGP